MTAEQFRTWIAPISQFAAVLVIAGTVIVWGLKLQDRVDRLDAEVQALLTNSPSQSQAPNSVACANLADRVASALADHSRYGDSAAVTLRALMSDLGCMTKKSE